MCSACGYDFGEGRGRRGSKGLSTKLLIPAAVLVFVAIVAAGVLTFTGRRKTTKAPTPAPVAGAVAAVRDSTSPPSGPESVPSADQSKAPRLGRAAAASRDLRDKLDDLVVKTLRERKRLTDVNRLTQKNSDLLNQIQGRLNELRGPVANLPAAQTEEALRAAIRGIEERMAEVRRMFGGLER
jgi:flagellar basal body-associated protein FliL